jgi:hypothetical protein
MTEAGTEEDKSANQPETDAEAGFLGFLFLSAIAYFAVFFWQLPDGAVRWIVTGLLVALAVAVWLAARHWGSVLKRLPVLKKWGHAASDLLVFVLVVAAVVLAAIYLAAEDKVVVLKIFAVVYFSLLPALLYLQFSSRRTLSVWKDYVANLYKLEIDDPANLPRPPTLSRFYPAWKEARDRAWAEGLLNDEGDRQKAEDRLELANQYRLKFRELFGRLPPVAKPQSVLSLQSVHKLQVVMATVLMTLGWTFVVQPETVFGRSFTPEDFELANLPSIPNETFAFAFLGAYFYILQMLVRRYFQNDLKATAYINATMRIVIVVLLVWVIDPLLADGTSQATRSAVAFAIGVFPTVGWQFLQQILVRKPIGLVVDSLEPKHKLGDLDGLNIWYESRLLEVGVEDMQNLTTTDIVDLMLNTRIPVDRMVDWIDQAFLYLRVVDEGQRGLLRSYGIRTATDLADALGDEGVAPSLKRLLNVALVDGTTKRGKANVVQPKMTDGKPDDDGLPSRMLTLRATISTERNLQHVHAWKSYTAVEEAAESQPQPEPEAPPTAAPVPV